MQAMQSTLLLVGIFSFPRCQPRIIPEPALQGYIALRFFRLGVFLCYTLIDCAFMLAVEDFQQAHHGQRILAAVGEQVLLGFLLFFFCESAVNHGIPNHSGLLALCDPHALVRHLRYHAPMRSKKCILVPCNHTENRISAIH